MSPITRRKYFRILALPGRVCCGPAWYGNGGGLNGAIGVVGVWDVSCGSLVPLSLDCDASPVLVYVLSSLICWSSFSLCTSVLVCVAAVVTWLHASVCWFSLPDSLSSDSSPTSASNLAISSGSGRYASSASSSSSELS